MKIGVLGTGMVGKTIGTKLVALGHEVKMGSRSAQNADAVAFAKEAGVRASAGTFADAADFGEIVFNCTAGTASLEALKAAGAERLGSKILIDVANALDFSKGVPRLAVCNDDSLAEQIQRAFPALRVVKALNTMNCNLMVEPGRVPGAHDAFLCGNDGGARQKVRDLLVEGFGWKIVHDLGDLTAARALEMYLPLWLRLYGALGSPDFNLHLARP